MADMKDSQMTLPLPDPGSWMTIKAVACLLGVNRKTVDRMITKGLLTGYAPYSAPDEKAPTLLWRDEAMAMLSARNRVAGAGR